VGEKSDPVGQISQALAALAAKQHGNVTRKQLLGLGMTRAQLYHAIDLGRLHPVHHGVYAVGRPARMPLERAAAAILACGPHALLSHHSALTLWGLAKGWTNPLHVTLARGDRRPPGLTTHRCRSLARQDIRRELGIRTTSPARTLLDCAPQMTAKALAKTVNEARLPGLLTPTAIDDVLTRNPLHPGAIALNAVDRDHNPTRSGWERDFLAFCARYGLPIPLINAPLNGYEVDALFPEHRLIVELDGWDYHQTRDAFEHDRERDAHALAAGLPTVRITKHRINTTPDREAARLRKILASRLDGGSVL
jgi:putative AbiEi antitoxin of type IV toxin-antitoxin system/uncharacterized protein DUF559